MLEKISKALGEELATQVEAKLKEAGIELGVVNDGTLVPAEKHDGIKQELKQSKADADAANAKIVEVQGKLDAMAEAEGATEQIKNDLATIKGDYEAYKGDAEKRIADVKKDFAIERGLVAAKANPDAIELLVGLFDKDKMTLDKDGNIEKWEDHLTPILAAKKSLFGVESLAGNDIPNPRDKDDAVSWQAKYAAALKVSSREAIKVKQEAFAAGVILT